MGLMQISRFICVIAFFVAFFGAFGEHEARDTVPLMVSAGLGWMLFDREIKAFLNNND